MTKQWIYGMTPEDFGEKLKKRQLFDGALAGATLLLNILFVLFRSDSTHTWFLLANIVTDIACGVYLVYDLSFRCAPQKRLLKLNMRMKETLSGVITEIEPYTTRYAKLDCYCVKLDRRRTFLPAGTLELEVGTQVELTLSGNVILEVAQ
jgi:hypothetical protein